MTARAGTAARKRTAKRRVEAPKLPRAELTQEQRQEAYARLDRLIAEGCWPILLIGEAQDGTVQAMSAPMSGAVIEGLTRRLAVALFPESFE